MSWNEWVRTAEIEPSIYAADFSCLGEQLEILLRGGVRIFQFDGGIGPDNIREVYEAGANLFVAGSSVFGREDIVRAYRRLVAALA